MINKPIAYALWFCFFSGGISAQEKEDSLVFRFRPQFGKELLQLDKKYISAQRDTLQITALKYYISDFTVYFSDASAVKSKQQYYLMDMENPETFRIAVIKNSGKSISKVAFFIGVDSIASVSGALFGALDPTKGMYWAWQSGYINMKIEGKSSSCQTRKNEFQFHIGGYLQPNYALRKVELPVKDSNLGIVVDLAGLFSKIELSRTNSIMIPGKPAMEMADYSIKMFRTE